MTDGEGNDGVGPGGRREGAARRTVVGGTEGQMAHPARRPASSGKARNDHTVLEHAGRKATGRITHLLRRAPPRRRSTSRPHSLRTRDVRSSMQSLRMSPAPPDLMLGGRRSLDLHRPNDTGIYWAKTISLRDSSTNSVRHHTPTAPSALLLSTPLSQLTPARL